MSNNIKYGSRILDMGVLLVDLPLYFQTSVIT